MTHKFEIKPSIDIKELKEKVLRWADNDSSDITYDEFVLLENLFYALSKNILTFEM